MLAVEPEEEGISIADRRLTTHLPRCGKFWNENRRHVFSNSPTERTNNRFVLLMRGEWDARTEMKILLLLLRGAGWEIKIPEAGDEATNNAPASINRIIFIIIRSKKRSSDSFDRDGRIRSYYFHVWSVRERGRDPVRVNQLTDTTARTHISPSGGFPVLLRPFCIQEKRHTRDVFILISLIYLFKTKCMQISKRGLCSLTWFENGRDLRNFKKRIHFHW